VKFEVNHKQDVLTVPNATLRWRPADNQLAPGTENPFTPKSGNKDGSRGGSKGGAKTLDKKKSHGGVLWVRDSKQPNRVKPLKVRTGISDGVVTEVMPLNEDAGLEGVEVVVAELRDPEAAESTATTNPFAPKFPPRRGGPR